MSPTSTTTSTAAPTATPASGPEASRPEASRPEASGPEASSAEGHRVLDEHPYTTGQRTRGRRLLGAVDGDRRERLRHGCGSGLLRHRRAVGPVGRDAGPRVAPRPAGPGPSSTPARTAPGPLHAGASSRRPPRAGRAPAESCSPTPGRPPTPRPGCSRPRSPTPASCSASTGTPSPAAAGRSSPRPCRERATPSRPCSCAPTVDATCCCAVRGRPLAAAAARVAPGRVWEVSHTGGHRFAPTAVLLPWGQTYARLDEQGAGWLLESSRTGHTPAELLGPLHDRGRSALAPAAQCAESHVRAALGETHLDSLWASAPTPSTEGNEVVVTHADGRSWLVRVARTPALATARSPAARRASRSWSIGRPR